MNKINIREYIDSGVLYDYAAGMLPDAEKAGVDAVCLQYPEVADELRLLQQALNTQAAPVAALQENIWNTLENINREKTGDINMLPVVNKYSDHHNWKRIVAPFMPQHIGEGMEVKVLRSSGGITQMLVISRTDVADEVHEQERECFIVLEGECECHVGDEVYRLGPGGFIDIPLYTSHHVRVLSPYVVAVLQHVAV